MMMLKIQNKNLARGALFALLQASATLAGSDHASGCSFTITSSGGIACPAGELADGQIRLNGSEPTAQFYFSDGKITDSEGKGCLITDAPTTQFQCDLNKSPAGGFAIDSSNTLSYNGSPQFYACPATNTEYNVYVHPDFGQTKCFPITLTTSDCGSAPPTTSCSASTLWQTSTITDTITNAVTSVITNVITSAITITAPPIQVTITLPASACSSSTTSSKRVCHKCSAQLNSTATWNTTHYSTSWATGYSTTGTGGTATATDVDSEPTDTGDDSDSEVTWKARYKW